MAMALDDYVLRFGVHLVSKGDNAVLYFDVPKAKGILNRRKKGASVGRGQSSKVEADYSLLNDILKDGRWN